jgi:predicted ester cyclase
VPAERRAGWATSTAVPGSSGILVQELIGDGDRVVARLRVVGKHTGGHPRMPEPTGRDFDVEQIWIFTLTDGLITEIRAVSDRLGMFLQLGWAWPRLGRPSGDPRSRSGASSRR